MCYAVGHYQVLSVGPENAPLRRVDSHRPANGSVCLGVRSSRLPRVIRRSAVHHAKAEPLDPLRGKTGEHRSFAQRIHRVGDHEKLSVESAVGSLTRISAHQLPVFLQLYHADVHRSLGHIRDATGCAEDEDVAIKQSGRLHYRHRREHLRVGGQRDLIQLLFPTLQHGVADVADADIRHHISAGQTHGQSQRAADVAHGKDVDAKATAAVIPKSRKQKCLLLGDSSVSYIRRGV